MPILAADWIDGRLLIAERRQFCDEEDALHSRVADAVLVGVVLRLAHLLLRGLLVARRVSVAYGA